MGYERQTAMIEKGRQIGRSVLDGGVLTECGIQKKDGLYLLYFFEGNIDEDQFGENGSRKEECYSFTELDKAMAYIASRGLDPSGLEPQRGNKIFYPNGRQFIQM